MRLAGRAVAACLGALLLGGCSLQRIDFDLGDLAFQGSLADEASRSVLLRRVYREERAWYALLGQVPLNYVNPVRTLRTVAQDKEVRHVRITAESRPEDIGISAGSMALVAIVTSIAGSISGGTLAPAAFLVGLLVAPSTRTVTFQCDVVESRTP